MLVGLISDTHIGYASDPVPPEIKASWIGVDLATLLPQAMEALRGVDLILHAGDIYLPSVLDKLESIAPVMAAWGDDDMPADFNSDKRMMKRHELSLDGVTLWLTHVKPPYELVDPVENLYFLRPSFGDAKEPPDPEEAPDVIVFGHTHSASIEHYKDVECGKDILLVNPGSATFPEYVAELGSVALLTIDSGEVQVRIMPLG